MRESTDAPSGDGGRGRGQEHHHYHEQEHEPEHDRDSERDNERRRGDGPDHQHDHEHGHGRDFGRGRDGDRGWEAAWRQLGGFGSGGHHGQRLDRGEVKLLVLSALAESAMHGYEIIRAFEARTQGAYVPSAGTIYPTLQLLEDLGYAQARQTDERRTYLLTVAGRAYLTERQEDVARAWARFGGSAASHGAPGQDSDASSQARMLLREDLRDLARSLFADGRVFRASPVAQETVRAALRIARQRIDAALEEAANEKDSEQGAADKGASDPEPHDPAATDQDASAEGVANR